MREIKLDLNQVFALKYKAIIIFQQTIERISVLSRVRPEDDPEVMEIIKLWDSDQVSGPEAVQLLLNIENERSAQKKAK